MLRHIIFVFVQFFSPAIVTFCFGQQDTVAIRIKHKTGDINIDGLSSDPGWQNIDPIALFVLEPVYGAKPTEKSEFLMTYDEKYLYVAARLYYQDTTDIVARNFVRDGWRGDDWFAFDIDANNDKQNALRFAMYPLGSHYDMAISNDGIDLGQSTFNQNYDLIWDGKSRLTSEGWFMEFKIPFAALRFKPKGKETVMNISATRQNYKKAERQHFPKVPQNAVDPTRKPSLKHPVIFEDLAASRLLYVTPSITTGFTQKNNLDIPKSQYVLSRKWALKPSLDIKYNLSPGLIADVTLNTDFAQAETDIQQFNLSRFSVFFPEKRNFFQEQAGLFEFKLGSNSQLFYSRTVGLYNGNVVPLIGGARLTGKIGKTDIGMMNLQSSGFESLDKSLSVGSQNFTVVRTRNKVLNPSSYIGTMLTARLDGKQNNIAGGLDAIIRMKGQHYLMGALASSYNQSSPSSVFQSGRANLVWEVRKQDKFFHSLQYSYSGKQFNPALGFVDRSSFHNVSLSISYGAFAKHQSALFRYQKASLINDVYLSSISGDLESAITTAEYTATTFQEHYFRLRWIADYETITDTLSFGPGLDIPANRYFFNQLVAHYTAPTYLTFKFATTVTHGGFYDGRRTSVLFEPSWSINKYFELSCNYNIDYLKFRSRNIKSTVHLGGLKLAFAFNLQLSGQIQTQYNSTIRKVLSNARIRYHFSDGHDLYIVYNHHHNYDRYRETPILPGADQQQFMLKYLFTLH